MSVLGQECPGDQAAVCDDGDGVQLQGILAIVYQTAQEFGVEEGLTPSEVELFHTGILEQC